MKILKKYFESNYLPILLYVLAFSLTITCAGLCRSLVLSMVMMGITSVLFIGIIIASILNFTKKRWKNGLLNLGYIFLSVIITVIGFGFFVASSMFGPSEDKFANNLTIPNNIDITEPKNWSEESSSSQEDTFQRSLLDTLKVAGDDDSSVSAELSSLIKLNRNEPDIIKRYLATSPAWRVFKERGDLFATRRWMIGSQWRYTLHGYYTRSDLDRFPDQGTDYFQNRVTLGFSGKTWGKGSKTTTQLSQGQTANLVLSLGNQMNESHCVINADGLFVEVFEQSKAKERRLTKAALTYLEKEFTPLLQQPTWDKIKEIIPPNSIKNGEPLIRLWNSFQPGLYDSEIWVN